MSVACVAGFSAPATSRGSLLGSAAGGGRPRRIGGAGRVGAGVGVGGAAWGGGGLGGGLGGALAAGGGVGGASGLASGIGGSGAGASIETSITSSNDSTGRSGEIQYSARPTATCSNAVSARAAGGI